VLGFEDLDGPHENVVVDSKRTTHRTVLRDHECYRAGVVEDEAKGRAMPSAVAVGILLHLFAAEIERTPDSFRWQWLRGENAS
jgi:nitrogen fixation-related uncharacterized protein